MGEAMSIDDVREALADSGKRNKWIGVWVGVLAALLAVCAVGGDNATKDANKANIDATNTWAFFQAKNIRRTSFTLAADELELTLQAHPAMPAEARAAIEAKVKSYRDTVKRYARDPESKEGLDDLFQRAKEIEAERDLALRKDPYFDFAQALLQIAIVLASVAIIAGTDLLVILSFVAGGLGTLLMLNGFALLISLPGLG
jgi:hypothetical protein